uniref:Uncharacterized protein n=1 Tax=Sphaerodactylus townsendi TaxID=933632 RepID=A0ACB8EBR0_9SAUR
MEEREQQCQEFEKELAREKEVLHQQFLRDLTVQDKVTEQSRLDLQRQRESLKALRTQGEVDSAMHQLSVTHLECQTACEADYATQEASLMNFTQDLKEGGELELDPPVLRAIYNHSSPAGPTWAQELLRVEAEINITPKQIQMADPRGATYCQLACANWD